jgi:hypothetical protein
LTAAAGLCFAAGTAAGHGGIRILLGDAAGRVFEIQIPWRSGIAGQNGATMPFPGKAG